MCRALPTMLIVSNILLDFLLQAIIVERNLHAYYRLPTSTVKTSNDTEVYYILQCPFRSSMNIPKPQDMPICLIVGRHSENDQKQKELLKAKPRTTLNTQVDFRQLKPSNFLKLVKIKNGKPYTIFLKPVTKKTLAKEQYKIPNIKFVITNPKAAANESSLLYSIPLIQKTQTNDSLALSSSKEPQQLNHTQLASVESEFLDGAQDEQDTQPSPLKYLAVPGTIKKLQLVAKRPLAATNQTLYKSQKFFADFENYKKGFRSKGLQNMYHRDETYHDHIFYDDLQQMGNYQINEKLQQQNQP